MVGKTRANELNREKKLKEMREYCFFLLLLLLSRTDCVRSERGFIVDEFGEVFFLSSKLRASAHSQQIKKFYLVISFRGLTPTQTPRVNGQLTSQNIRQ